MIRIAVLLAACATLSCGIIGGDAACDFREGSLNGPEPRCQEYEGSVASGTFKGACIASGGKVIDGLCPREGTLGGCILGTQGDGSRPTDWYYPAPPSEPGYNDGWDDAEDVKRVCTGAGEEFVPAP